MVPEHGPQHVDMVGHSLVRVQEGYVRRLQVPLVLATTWALCPGIPARAPVVQHCTDTGPVGLQETPGDGGIPLPWLTGRWTRRSRGMR